nr:hypothetical protein CFP56_40421 [Quercus suber]
MGRRLQMQEWLLGLGVLTVEMRSEEREAPAVDIQRRRWLRGLRGFGFCPWGRREGMKKDSSNNNVIIVSLLV